MKKFVTILAVLMVLAIFKDTKPTTVQAGDFSHLKEKKVTILDPNGKEVQIVKEEVKEIKEKTPLEDFFNKYAGTFTKQGSTLTTDPYQCVSFANLYIKEMFGLEAPMRNAKDWFLDFENTNLKDHFIKVKNTPNGVPPDGAIVVSNSSSYGHIEVKFGKADNNTFEAYGQNWTPGEAGSGNQRKGGEIRKVTRKYKENYNVGLPTPFNVEVLGWLVPKTPENEKMVNIANYLENNCSADLHGKADLFLNNERKYKRNAYAVLAVITADTGCGKNLTTPFNYGNVGNTDSNPNAQAFSTPDEGVEAVFQTLANEYLGNATYLCHLSRGGWNVCPEGKTINKGKFYASDPVNWQKNTNAVMTLLTGQENAGNSFNIQI